MRWLNVCHLAFAPSVLSDFLGDPKAELRSSLSVVAFDLHNADFAFVEPIAQEYPRILDDTGTSKQYGIRYSGIDPVVCDLLDIKEKIRKSCLINA